MRRAPASLLGTISSSSLLRSDATCPYVGSSGSYPTRARATQPGGFRLIGASLLIFVRVRLVPDGGLG